MSENHLCLIYVCRCVSNTWNIQKLILAFVYPRFVGGLELKFDN
jgi:hypothetical protein